MRWKEDTPRMARSKARVFRLAYRLLSPESSDQAFHVKAFDITCTIEKAPQRLNGHA
jgi:hypothetical protein